MIEKTHRGNEPHFDPLEVLDAERRNAVMTEPGLSRVLERIAERPGEIPRHDEAARIVRRSPQAFRRLFEARCGMNYKQFVKQFRLHVARRLLCDFGWAVGRVAEFLGYGRRAALAMLFRRAYGRPPSAFRRT